MRLDIFNGVETRNSDEGLSVRVNDLLGDIASENFTRGFGAGRVSGRAFGDLFISSLVNPAHNVAAAYYDVTYLFSKLMYEHGEGIFGYLHSLEDTREEAAMSFNVPTTPRQQNHDTMDSTEETK